MVIRGMTHDFIPQYPPMRFRAAAWLVRRFEGIIRAQLSYTLNCKPQHSGGDLDGHPVVFILEL
jgi:hypothetical protein